MTPFSGAIGEFGRNAVAIRGLYWNLVNGPNEKRVYVDPDTQEILRHPITGFARACKLGDAGEVIHKVDPATVKASFAGYYGNPAASQCARALAAQVSSSGVRLIAIRSSEPSS